MRDDAGPARPSLSSFVRWRPCPVLRVNLKVTATSRGSLKRVIRRLTETLSSIGGTKSTTEVTRGGLDYASLVSLCDSSRSDAIRTMTDLSTRLSVSNSAVSASPRPRHSSTPRHGGRHSRLGMTRESSSRDAPRAKKRLSRTTMSSNSTKLGEVRRPGAWHGQEPRVAYPRRLQKHDAPVKRKKRWGIF